MNTYINAEEKYIEIINKCWEDADFKNRLLKNPIAELENSFNLNIKENHTKELIVLDQTDPNTIHINIPAPVDLDNLELTNEQLEMVAGGATPAIITTSSGYCVAGGAAAVGFLVSFL